MGIRNTDKKLKKNGFSLLIFLCVIILLFNIGSAARVIFIDGDKYRQQAESQQMSDTVLTAPRGTIYDRNMNVLVKSATAWVLCATPGNIGDVAEKIEVPRAQIVDNIAKFCSDLFEISYDTVYEKLDNEKGAYAQLQKQVTAIQKQKIQEFVEENNYGGILYFTPSSMRYYPKNNFASVVLGFTNSDGEGKGGVELVYNEQLTGTPGRIITAKDARGNAMSSDYETVVDAQEGTGLILTIDSTIQHYLEKELEQGREDCQAVGAYGIVMDVKTGAVLAMSNKPDYDSNNAYKIYDKDERKRVEELKGTESYSNEFTDALYSQWKNKTISFVYEPGSVFKIFTLSAGIEEGVVSENTKFTCGYEYQVASERFHCANHVSHGSQTVREGLMNSCNKFFINIGQILGAQTYYKYFEAFGFTEQTGMDLAGESQPVAGVTYHPKDSFSKVNLASTSFGQTIKVSPIQIITAACCIANGGNLMQPYIVAGTVDSDGNVLSTTEPVVRRQVISESTSKLVCSMMESVVLEGTGTTAYVPGYHVAGKTATSQKIQESNEQGRAIYSGSFVCFAPANDPQIAVLVIMDEPGGINYGGSKVAAPVAKEVIKNSLIYLNVEPEYTESELKTAMSTTPKLIGNTVSSAKVTASNAGYTTKVIGEGDTVVAQNPSPNQTVAPGGVIILYTESDETSSKVEVPDFTDKSLSQVNQLAASFGLNITFSGPSIQTGTMRSFRQNVEAGTKVEAGSSITVYFQEGTGLSDVTD